jgi:hypothetical protein
MQHIKATVIPILSFLLCLNASCGGSREPSVEDVRNIQIHIEKNTLPSYVSTDERGRKQWDWTKQAYMLRSFDRRGLRKVRRSRTRMLL